MAVMVVEILNTALEKLCDFVHPKLHPQIKVIKDIAASAALIAAVGSVIIGVLVFFDGPEEVLINLFFAVNFF